MAGFFANLFGVRVPRIDEPTLGFYDLSRGKDAGLVALDYAALLPIFHRVIIGHDTPPDCDVLFLYCNLSLNGAVTGSQFTLREIIRDSGAIIAVIASPNSTDAYIAAVKGPKYRSVNLVMTLDRKGEAFNSFFCRLFTEMNDGVSMPIAWNTLAPQQPGIEHLGCPDAIFSCEAGQVSFG